MSEYDSEIETQETQETVPKTKKQISDAQRSARIENLKRGRETRLANVAKKKAKAARTQKYEVQESSESDDSDSSSDEEELVLKSRKKVRPSVSAITTKASKSGRGRDSSSSIHDEVSQLKDMILALAKQKKKKKAHKTVINIPAQQAPQQPTNSASDYYKTKLLKL